MPTKPAAKRAAAPPSRAAGTHKNGKNGAPPKAPAKPAVQKTPAKPVAKAAPKPEPKPAEKAAVSEVPKPATKPAKLPPGAPIHAVNIERFRAAFEAEPEYIAALNAVTKTSIHSVAQRRKAVIETDHVFSHTVKVGGVTSQNNSGRCWLFAGLNPMRVAAIAALDVDEKFELSQNYMMFWDKFEKANYFLESILKTRSEAFGSRLLDYLLESPIQDGGQWDMFVNLVKKYGVIPKSVMPETESSSNTRIMNAAITAKLREYASKLRRKGPPIEALRAEKSKMLTEVYRMLSIHLGEPPHEFRWQWRDKDNEFHRDGEITPQEFYKRYVSMDLDSRICLIHCPQPSKKFNTLYTIDYLGNVVEGEVIRYLNVDLKHIKSAAIEMLKHGDPVWFGCDVGKMLDRDLGILDTDLYDYESVYGLKFGMDKATRLDYGESRMNHAMVFAGVDLDDKGKPLKWRVENSWGDKGEGKGFLTMSDEWFDHYVYEVAVDKKHVQQELLRPLFKEPIHLPPWDPMGALAR